MSSEELIEKLSRIKIIWARRPPAPQQLVCMAMRAKRATGGTPDPTAVQRAADKLLDRLVAQLDVSLTLWGAIDETDAARTLIRDVQCRLYHGMLSALLRRLAETDASCGMGVATTECTGPSRFTPPEQPEPTNSNVTRRPVVSQV